MWENFSLNVDVDNVGVRPQQYEKLKQDTHWPRARKVLESF